MSTPPTAPTMLPLIEAKRDGHTHDLASLRFVAEGAARGTIPDYQLAAWLMAVVCRGMSEAETADLTVAMAESGDVLDLTALPGPVVDKHSTGGVGDKTSLVVGPLAAATGLTVAKMSGRGLGHTGGTLDKLESIPGLSVDLDPEAFVRQAADVRLVIAGQTADLAPADKALYALRDVTGTVPSLPLIASSIMSKKIAAGASAIALDVKFGAGAFMPTLDEARALGAAMVDLGQRAGRRTVAALSTMEQPLGRAVGNALEVAEAIATLRSEGPEDLRELCLVVTGLMHVAAGKAERSEDVRPALEAALADGNALERFRAMVTAQGGDGAVVDRPADVLPQAPLRVPAPAPVDGRVTRVDARAVGNAAVGLGGGTHAQGGGGRPGGGHRARGRGGAARGHGRAAGLGACARRGRRARRDRSGAGRDDDRGAGHAAGLDRGRRRRRDRRAREGGRDPWLTCRFPHPRISRPGRSMPCGRAPYSWAPCSRGGRSSVCCAIAWTMPDCATDCAAWRPTRWALWRRWRSAPSGWRASRAPSSQPTSAS